jgi:hypothetical protein
MTATAAVRRPSATTSSRARWEPKSPSRSSSPSSPLTRSCSPRGRRSNGRQRQIDKEACPVFGRTAHLRQQNIARGLSPIMPKQYTSVSHIRQFYFYLLLNLVLIRHKKFKTNNIIYLYVLPW